VWPRAVRTNARSMIGPLGKAQEVPETVRAELSVVGHAFKTHIIEWGKRGPYSRRHPFRNPLFTEDMLSSFPLLQRTMRDQHWERVHHETFCPICLRSLSIQTKKPCACPVPAGTEPFTSSAWYFKRPSSGTQNLVVTCSPTKYRAFYETRKLLLAPANRPKSAAAKAAQTQQAAIEAAIAKHAAEHSAAKNRKVVKLMADGNDVSFEIIEP
jgi:hypothetical protein